MVQVRDDLLTGRLPCPTKVLATLAAYWAQSEYGQFSFKSVDQELAGGFRFVRPDEKLKNADDEIDQDETFLDKVGLLFSISDFRRYVVYRNRAICSDKNNSRKRQSRLGPLQVVRSNDINIAFQQNYVQYVIHKVKRIRNQSI